VQIVGGSDLLHFLATCWRFPGDTDTSWDAKQSPKGPLPIADGCTNKAPCHTITQPHCAFVCLPYYFVDLDFICHLMGGTKSTDAIREARRPSRDRRFKETHQITRQRLAPKDLLARTAALLAARAPLIRPQRAQSKCARGAAPTSSLAPPPRFSRAICASPPDPHAHRPGAHHRARKNMQKPRKRFHQSNEPRRLWQARPTEGRGGPS